MRSLCISATKKKNNPKIHHALIQDSADSSVGADPAAQPYESSCRGMEPAGALGDGFVVSLKSCKFCDGHWVVSVCGETCRSTWTVLVGQLLQGWVEIRGLCWGVQKWEKI